MVLSLSIPSADSIRAQALRLAGRTISYGPCVIIDRKKRIALYRKAIPKGQYLDWTCETPFCGNPDHFLLRESLPFTPPKKVAERKALTDIEICRYMASGKRLALYDQPIPEGMRLGWTCNVPYCGKPEHFCLELNKNSNQRDYKRLRTQLRELPEDGFFDLPAEPTEEKGLIKFRKGLATGKTPHFIIRTLPTGGIRIIRTGDWGDDKTAVLRKYPNLVVVAKFVRSIGSVFLGQFWGTWDDPIETRKPRVKTCSEKGCPWPRMEGATVCRQHWLWDSAVCSYSRESKIHVEREAYSRKSDDRSVGSGRLDALLHSGWIGEDKYGYLNTTTLTKSGGFVQRSKAERENDKWWKENVIDQGIEAPGVMVRKTAKELKIEMEEMIDRSLIEYSAQQSEANIKAFWRATKEPNPLHDDPFHPNEPRLKIGDGAAVSLKGKMRRGGGHGQGIRKKQRKRSAGWTSSRHNHDPQYFTRDTIKAMDYDEFAPIEVPEYFSEEEYIDE